jgi:RNA polymerase sigma-70 factor (ECF subfamily)
MATLDLRFLDRLRRRDAEALRLSVEQNARPLYRAARGMGFSHPEAEDLVQDVFATFLETLDRFEGRSEVRTWLFGILHHKSLERHRQLAREDQHDPIDDVFESCFDARGNWVRPPLELDRLAASSEAGDAIRACLDHLPALQREVFVLREIEQRDAREVCNILGRTITHVGVLFHRARARLRHCLETRGWGAKR